MILGMVCQQYIIELRRLGMHPLLAHSDVTCIVAQLSFQYFIFGIRNLQHVTSSCFGLMSAGSLTTKIYRCTTGKYPMKTALITHSKGSQRHIALVYYAVTPYKLMEQYQPH